jgi:hypothetical protein
MKDCSKALYHKTHLGYHPEVKLESYLFKEGG